MPPHRRTGRSGDSYYDRGEDRAKALAEVLKRWKRERGAPSEPVLAHEVGLRIGRKYERNEIRRTLAGEARLYHLTPQMVEAYVAAFDKTEPADVAEAFHAVGLLPPEVTREALRLAIATSRSGRRNPSQVA